jgi:NADH:ubiquinone oxidoreductase subunit 4 (subunit M)
MPNASLYFAPLIFTLAVLGVIYASITTLRQTDLKRIIAYSSIAHMGIVTIGIFTLTIIGIEGSIFLQISHGLVASALFLIVTFIYDRHHTRLVKYYRGLAITMPLYSTIFLFFTLANIAVPLSCNFVGELVCLVSAYEVNSTVAILASLGMVLSASYSLFLYNRVNFGSISPYIAASADNRDISRRELYVILPLVILTIVLGIYPQLIFDSIHASVVNLTTYLQI